MSNVCYVSRVNPSVDGEALKTVLGVVGEISSVTKRGDHYVVTYTTSEAAQTALILTGTNIVDRPIEVKDTPPDLDPLTASNDSRYSTHS